MSEHTSGVSLVIFFSPYNVISAVVDYLTLKFFSHSSWVQLFGESQIWSGLLDASLHFLDFRLLNSEKRKLGSEKVHKHGVFVLLLCVPTIVE